MKEEKNHDVIYESVAQMNEDLKVKFFKFYDFLEDGEIDKAKEFFYNPLRDGTELVEEDDMYNDGPILKVMHSKNVESNDNDINNSSSKMIP
tara:strand:+ start:98 stop:373 length:276 start_codon:yes stop_codon:yes gene_type:complete